MSELLYSTDELWYGNQTGRVLTGEIDNIYDTLGGLNDKYAPTEHVHSEYATIEALDKKADVEHKHDDLYYSKAEVDDKLDALKTEIVELVEKKLAEKDEKTETSEDVAEEPSTSDTDTASDAKDSQ